MFVSATFASKAVAVHALVPTTAVLHLHDRDWVFVPAGNGRFRRVEVHSGNTVFRNKQEILSGIVPGQQVVSNVLQLEATLEGQ
jgi:cobalt-zinc-cadmium efflux system membrane fusion protein